MTFQSSAIRSEYRKILKFVNPGAPGCNTRAANHLKIAFSLFYSFFSKLAKGSKPGKFPSLSYGLSEILKGAPPKAKEAHERPLPMRRTSIPGG